MEKKLNGTIWCPVCYGKLVLIYDYYNFRYYLQCLECGSEFKQDMSDLEK